MNYQLWRFRLSNLGKIWSDSHNFVVFLSVVVATAIVLGRQIAYGPGLGGDSIVYVSVARNLIEGNGFKWYITDSIYTVYPPGYPVLLALASFFVFDPFDTAGPLNALLYGLNIFVAGFWIKQNVSSRFFNIWGCLAIASSLSLTGLATVVLSETSFILFVTLSLLQIEKHIKAGYYRSLIWSAAFAGIAFSIRYAGAALLISILLLLILQKNVTLLKKGKRLLTFGSISIAPMALWFARNIYLTGKLRELSDHAPPSRDFLEITNGVLSVLIEWVIPLARVGYPLRGGAEDIPPVVAVSVAIILAALTVVVVYLMTFQRKPRSDFPYHGFCAFGLFVPVYASFLIASMLWESRIGQFGVEPRYLAPIYIPCSLIALPLADRFLSRRHWKSKESNGEIADAPQACGVTGRRVRFDEAGDGPAAPASRSPRRRERRIRRIPWLRFTAGLILAFWLALHIPPHAKIMRDANKGSWSSLGYANHAWVNSEILQYIREAPITGNIASGNYIGLAYLYANQWQIYDSLPLDFPDLVRWIETSEEGTHIVWFTCCDWGHSYGIDELREIDGLEVVTTTKDGILFKVVGAKK